MNQGRILDTCQPNHAPSGAAIVEDEVLFPTIVTSMAEPKKTGKIMLPTVLPMHHAESRNSAQFPQDNEFFSFPCSPGEIREQKERFLIFLRILVKYLERRDPDGYEKVKSALRECALQQRRSSLFLMDLYDQTKRSVSSVHWQTAYTFLGMFMARRHRDRAIVSADGS